MTLVEMAGNDVVVIVNGKRITADEVRKRMNLRVKLKEQSLRNQPGAAERLSEFANYSRRVLVYEIINSTLVEEYGRKNGCQATEMSWNVTLKRFLEGYGDKATITTVSASAGVTEADIESFLRRRAYLRDVFAMFDPSVTNIERDAILAGKERVAEYNRNVAESNKVQLATCSAILKKLGEGMDFSVLAATDSEFHAEQGNFWGVFTREELEDEGESVAKWAFSADVGAIGGPFEMEDGYAIVKLVSRTSGAARASLAAVSVASVTLARINVRQFMGMDELADEDIATMLSDSRAKKAEKALLHSLYPDMNLEFPHGENLYDVETNVTKNVMKKERSTR